nr:hypothetical protein [Tanacetum cinerariifolium]
MVELRSMAVRCRTHVSERILRRRRLIHHLENAKGCSLTSGWLTRLKANQMEDLGHLGVVTAFVDKMYVVVRLSMVDVNSMVGVDFRRLIHMSCFWFLGTSLGLCSGSFPNSAFRTNGFGILVFVSSFCIDCSSSGSCVLISIDVGFELVGVDVSGLSCLGDIVSVGSTPRRVDKKKQFLVLSLSKSSSRWFRDVECWSRLGVANTLSSRSSEELKTWIEADGL